MNDLISKLDRSKLSAIEFYENELHIDTCNGFHLLVFNDNGWFNFILGPTLSSMIGPIGYPKMNTLDGALSLINNVSNLGVIK
jgi:hypothetical protein